MLWRKKEAIRDKDVRTGNYCYWRLLYCINLGKANVQRLKKSYLSYKAQFLRWGQYWQICLLVRMSGSRDKRLRSASFSTQLWMWWTKVFLSFSSSEKNKLQEFLPWLIVTFWYDCRKLMWGSLGKHMWVQPYLFGPYGWPLQGASCQSWGKAGSQLQGCISPNSSECKEWPIHVETHAWRHLETILCK